MLVTGAICSASQCKKENACSRRPISGCHGNLHPDSRYNLKVNSPQFVEAGLATPTATDILMYMYSLHTCMYACMYVNTQCINYTYMYMYNKQSICTVVLYILDITDGHSCLWRIHNSIIQHTHVQYSETLYFSHGNCTQ